MSGHNLDPVLVKKYAAKFGLTELNFRKKVSAFGTKKHIELQSALVLFVEENGERAGVAFRKLSPEQKKEVQAYRGMHQSASSAVGTRSKKRPLKAVGQEFHDPFLTAKGSSDCPAIQSEAYSIFFILENSLRAFITRVFQSAHGIDWWEKLRKSGRVNDIVTEVERRMNEEAENFHYSKRSVHEIYYADYSHLLRIMDAFGREFSKFFSKQPESTLKAKLGELRSTRNIVAHNNPIRKKDLVRLKIHTEDWIEYMNHIHGKSEQP